MPKTTIERIAIDEIVESLPDRSISEHLVDVLTESIDEIGLLSPIVVTPDHRLVAGRHRLAAAKRLGWTKIDATVVERGDLATLDENMVRLELTVLEYAEALDRRKAIYDVLHPDTVANSTAMMVRVRLRLPASGPAFADTAVELTNKSRSTVERMLRIVRDIEPDIRDLVRPTGSADVLDHLIKLADLEPEPRRRVAERLAAGDAWREARAVANDVAAESVEAAPQQALLRLDPVSATAGVGVAAGGAPREPRMWVGSGPNSPSQPLPLDAGTRVLSEIAVVKRAWYDGPSTPVITPALLPLEELGTLPVVPLQADWVSSDLAVITRAGVPVAHLPVERLTVSGIVQKSGNRKTDGVFAIANTLSQGCYRILTGFDKCGLPCYSDGSAGSGCYANNSEFARQAQNVAKGYNVISNGVVNDLMKIRLPQNGRGDLTKLLDGQTDLVRVDAESSDGSLSISLGILQSWAEMNPNVHVTTVSSGYFRPSDAMLSWLSVLPNAWVGATTSAWFGEAEIEARFAGIERLLAFGIPTVIWIATHPDWDNDAVLRRARQLVADDLIIETPTREGNRNQRLPLLGVNPLGACGDQRYDGKDRLVTVVSGEPGDVPKYEIETEDGGHETPYGGVHARCLGCGLKCGFNPLSAVEQHADDETDEREAAA